MRTAIPHRTEKERLDQILVERGLVRSRAAAQALIMSGRVTVDGQQADKAGQRLSHDADVSVTPSDRQYASRGGQKLAGALDTFGLRVAGDTALDVGASTGGFTDCLIQRHASHVVALDVGKGQLDWRLRNDARVTLIEGLNARGLIPDDLPEAKRVFDIITVDVSFISLKLILPPLLPLLQEEGSLVALVKPQFEVGRGQVGKGGIVRDLSQRAKSLADVAGAARQTGFSVRNLAASVLPGMEGNQEFFMLADRSPGGLSEEEIIARAQDVAGA